MDKKIGILTYHNSDNFGSVLQAYALSHYLNSEHIVSEIIDYRKKEVQQLYQIFQPIDSRYHLLTNLYCIPYYRMLQTRKSRFEFFRQTMLPLSASRYTKKEQLVNCKYERYIVGSDQVWNVGIVDFDLSYMLDFADGDKIAYGASFGPKDISYSKLKPFSQYLSKFRRISVREALSKQVCEEKLGLEVEVVCDPVFLLTSEDWQRISVKYQKRPQNYILAYYPGGFSTEQDAYSKYLSKERKCKRILLMPEWRNAFRTGIKAYDCGPAEFLDLFMHADCVCTSSFHGTAFSLLFGKEAYVNLNNKDNRISTLLRYIPEEKKTFLGEVVKISCCSNLPALQRMVKCSKEFLQNAIGFR